MSLSELRLNEVDAQQQSCSHINNNKENKSMAREMTKQEINQVLELIQTKRHAKRDKAILLMCLYAGLTIKEVVNLEICQVISNDGEISEEVTLGDQHTTAGKERVVYLNKKLRKALNDYLCERFNTDDLLPILLTDTKRQLFTTQKSINRGFTANTLAGHLYDLIEEAGIEQASSFSLRKSFAYMITAKVLSPRFMELMDNAEDRYAIARSIESNPATLRKVVDLI
jgi:integrase/recombinase XerD